MALIDLARQQTRDEIEQLAEDIREGNVTAEQEDGIRDQVRTATDEEQSDAIDENPAIADLIAALDLPPPERFGLGEGTLGEPDEPVAIEEAEEQPAELPSELEGVPDADRGQAERGFSGRPDPRFGGQDLTRRFPQPNVRAQFQQLETTRRNLEDRQDDDVAPGRFYDEFAEDVLGNPILTREEFVAAEQSPGATGMFQ